MSELKPCPFCEDGGNPNVVTGKCYTFEDGNGSHVECWKCFAYGPMCNTEEEAIATWNQRADRTCHMTLKKSGPFYDVWHFDCCEKEWAEPRCVNGVVDYPGLVCPWCGARVVGD